MLQYVYAGSIKMSAITIKFHSMYKLDSFIKTALNVELYRIVQLPANK